MSAPAADLSWEHLAAALVLVAIAAGLSWWQRTGQADDIAIAVVRSFLQLSAVGFVISAIFDNDSLAVRRRAADRDGRLRDVHRARPGRRACRASLVPIAIGLGRRRGGDARARRRRRDLRARGAVRSCPSAGW